MSRPLQQTGHRESRYERPNQKWVCGWACDGSPCELGPDGKGRCPAKGESECTPRRDGDRWVCTRLQVFGGACEQGPNPDGSCCHPTPTHPVCRPRLSIKAKRGRLAWGAFLLTAAGLIVLAMGPWGREFTSPGALSGPHASLDLASADNQSCQACHATSGNGATANAANLGMTAGHTQNTKCLQCHFQDSDGQTVQNPHSVDAKTLQTRGEAQNQSAGNQAGDTPSLQLASAMPPEHAKGGTVACARCHREHQGKMHDLTRMSNTQCQVCHTQQFKNFPSGHPKFPDDTPRTTGIKFNHQSHKARHFGDESFSCAKCHTRDAAGKTMTLKPFAQSCASCHNKSNDGDHHGEQIKKTRQVVLRIPPGLDGPWSRDAQAGAPELPATMLLLLAGAQRSETIEALHHLYTQADGGLFDWQPPQADQANAGSDYRRALARGVEQLIRDLEAPKAAYWLRHRLARALDADPEADAIVAMAEQLSGARLAVSSYAGRWLPGGQLNETPSADDMPGWQLSNGGRSLRYQPTRHAAPLLKATFDSVTHLLNANKNTPQARDTTGEDAAAQNLQAMRLQLSRRAATSLTATETPAGALASCMKCHQREDNAQTPTIAWQQSQRQTGQNGFAAFPHDTHFAVLGSNQSCNQCHQLTEQSSDEPAHATRAHGLAGHDLQSCSQCHQPEKANNNCITCHKYHWQRP